MTTHEPTRIDIVPADPDGIRRLRDAGRDAAGSVRLTASRAGAMPGKHRPAEVKASIAACYRSAPRSPGGLLDHARLVGTALKETESLGRSLRRHPVVADAHGNTYLRAYATARQYLVAAGDRFSEERLTAFLDGYQEVMELEMGEIWALKPALQMALLERITESEPAGWPPLITSLRHVGEAPWRDVLESVSKVEAVLARDPAGAYAGMDAESRDSYRVVVAALAKRSKCSERQVAEEALQLAMEAAHHADGSRATERCGHIGYYLLDKGLSRLRAVVGYRLTPGDRIRDTILHHADWFYLFGVELVTFAIVVGLLSFLSALTPILAGLLLVVLPATQAAVDFMNNLAAFVISPRALPKLDFSKGIPSNCTTMVAVPTLLLNEAQVRNLVRDLEIRYLANSDPNLLFVLLTDSPDSDQPVDERDKLVEAAVELIEGLNRNYSGGGQPPFYLFHRHRIFNPAENRWMGWERKRGKLLDLNRLLRGAYDSFPVKAGDLSRLPTVRYVITLDSDTQLPRDSAAKLIGTIAHPLNRAVVEPATRVVIAGYGILQPRIGISVRSASRSRLAALFSGETGFDIYTRAISDVYQDLFGEGIFTGKGIYEVDVMRETLERRFPENALLSHDLIEGAYARAALVSDIELIDDYPSHFSAYSRRKHRWVRGDWQIMRWLLSRVPDYHGRMIPNPTSLISRWKIVDNLRRSLQEPAMLLLLLAGWFYLPGPPWYWSAVGATILLLPVDWNLLFSVLRAPLGSRTFPAWAKDTAEAFVRGNLLALLTISFLLNQALLSLDAIARTVRRVWITKRNLLQWETAAEAEETTGPSKATVDLYLEWTPWLAAAIGAAVWLLRPAQAPYASGFIAMWIASRGISARLNRPPRRSRRRLSDQDIELLRDAASRIYQYFRDWSSPATNWLVPDNVREDGTAAARVSPTNLGILLNARIAAVHFGLLGVEEFAAETLQTLRRIAELQKHRGHLLNWYDMETLSPLEPAFVSTVDSGNLAACLWTLKQAAMAFAADAERGVTPAAAAQLAQIVITCDRMVEQMDFRFLYQSKKKVLSVGFNIAADRLETSSYDLLASESRTAAFIAIAKGDIPQEAWFHLGRGHTVTGGERVLISWTGTMFEYLMPTLWMQTYRRTILEKSIQAAVRVQREFTHRRGVPWGVSESACRAEGDSEYGYSAFGIPQLAMRPNSAQELVISPYSTFLALTVDPATAVENLRRMQERGWFGRYGFYEAIDCSEREDRVIHLWMAHHQGMSLLAACNLLFNQSISRYFHAEPHVLATELLLHERVPSAVTAEAEEQPTPEVAAAEAGA